jgi:dUTP pyrophosphatase
MLLTKKEILEMIGKGLLVQDMVDKDIQIQQSGIDLTAAKVFRLEGHGTLDFTNEKRKLPEYKEIEFDEKIILEPGTYHVAFNERIVLPKNIAGMLLPRSSALACGIVQHTALWDPGYHGRAFFHVEVSRPVTIFRNARLGQMVFFKLPEDTESYCGYSGEDVLKNAKRGNNENNQS